MRSRDHFGVSDTICSCLLVGLRRPHPPRVAGKCRACLYSLALRSVPPRKSLGMRWWLEGGRAFGAVPPSPAALEREQRPEKKGQRRLACPRCWCQGGWRSWVRSWLLFSPHPLCVRRPQSMVVPQLCPGEMCAPPPGSASRRGTWRVCDCSLGVRAAQAVGSGTPWHRSLWGAEPGKACSRAESCRWVWRPRFPWEGGRQFEWLGGLS